MKRIITIKRGSSFSLPVLIMGEDDNRIDKLNISNMSSQIRSDNDDFIEDLLITQDALLSGTFIVSKDDTAAWPLENLYLDIRYTIDNVIYFTETIVIKVIKQQTILIVPEGD